MAAREESAFAGRRATSDYRLNVRRLTAAASCEHEQCSQPKHRQCCRLGSRSRSRLPRSAARKPCLLRRCCSGSHIADSRNYCRWARRVLDPLCEQRAQVSRPRQGKDCSRLELVAPVPLRTAKKSTSPRASITPGNMSQENSDSSRSGRLIAAHHHGLGGVSSPGAPDQSETQSGQNKPSLDFGHRHAPLKVCREFKRVASDASWMFAELSPGSIVLRRASTKKLAVRAGCDRLACKPLIRPDFSCWCSSDRDNIQAKSQVFYPFAD